MTIAAQTNRTSITGNGLTTSIPCTFPFTAQTDLVVVETIIATGAQTVKTLTTDYTVTGTVDALGQYPNGGTVVMTVAPASTVTITIYREVPTTQSVDPVQNDKLPVDSAIEAPLDKLTMIAIRLKEQVARSLHQPDGDSANMTTLPAKTTRASRYMGFDGDGNPTMMQTPTGMVTSIAQLTESTVAGLPAAGSAGSLRKVTDGVRGVWMDTGTRWTKLIPYVNVLDFGTDATAFNAAHTAAAASTQYKTIYVPAGTYTITAEILSTADDIAWLLDPGAVLDITSIAGTGTANIHATINVLACFKVTGARVRIVGGRITGAATADSKNTVGILLHGTSRSYIDMIKIDTLYCGIWAGNNATDVMIESGTEVYACTRNILMGYQPLTVTSPQVTRVTLFGVKSHGATGGDGVKLYSFARDVKIIGGEYINNSNNGIDMYVCGEYVMVTNALSQGNTVDGIDLKYALDSGEGANQLGFARRTIIRGNQFRSNGEYGIRAHVEAAFTGTDLGIENATIEGNHCEGNGVHGMICGLVGGVVSGNICVRNIQRGMMFTSCISTSIIGNHVGDNGTTGTNRSGVVFGVGLYAGAGNSRACTIVGNTAADTRSGGDRTQNRGFEWANLDDSVIIGNTGDNHSTADHNCSVVATGGTRSFANLGTVEAGGTLFGNAGHPIVARASLPAAGASQDGLLIVDDNGAGDRNLMLYAGGERFRIDGGSAV